MKSIRKSIHKLEYKFDCKMERFAFRHPYLAFASLFVATPVFILLTVFVATCSVILPFSLMFGWI